MNIKHETYMMDGMPVEMGDSDELRIKKIQIAFQSSENIKESCHILVDSVENSLEYLRERRTVVSSRLCEALAKKESLRKKDYNNIMDDISALASATWPFCFIICNLSYSGLSFPASEDKTPFVETPLNKS